MLSKINGLFAVSAACAISAGAMAGPSNLLQNPGFETAGATDVFANWTDFGGNVTFDLTTPIAGAVSAVMFGQFPGTGVQNDTVMIQGVPVTGGNLHEFSITARQSSADPLEPLAFCLVAFQYQNALNALIQEQIVFIGDNRDLDGDMMSDQIFPPLDTPTVITAQSPAPIDATTCTLVVVFVQIEEAMGSITFDEASLTDLGTFDFDQVWNLSFENGLVGQNPPGWFTTGTNAAQNGDAPTDGERALLQFGNFPGDGSLNDTITRSNTFAVSEGDQVTATADVQHLAGDPLAVDNIAFLNVEFYDGIGQLVGAEGVTALESTDPTDTPITASVVASAPAGAVEAAIALGYQQSNEGPGAAHWDNVTLDVQPAPAGCDGDANGDLAVDVNDISFVLFRLGQSNGACGDGDANGDGVNDVNDISYVLFRLGTCTAGGPCN